MPLTKEELLKQRYKVTAPFPGMGCEVGCIIDQFIGNGNLLVPMKTGGERYKFVVLPDEMPHLFKPLEWYEDRMPDQMPEYLRYVVDFMGHYGAPLNSIYKVSEYKTWGDALAFYSDQLKGKPLYLAHTLPATEEEYNAFINITPKPAG